MLLTWTVYLARVFLPSNTGYDRIETVKYTDKCIRTLYAMGSGASSLSKLAISKSQGSGRRQTYRSVCGETPRGVQIPT